MRILEKLFSRSDAESLKKAGLIDPTRFHSRTPIGRTTAERLVEIPSLRVIQFHDVKPDRRTLSILNDIVFSRRKDVTLRVYGYPDTWADISFLKELPEVERFDWDTTVFGSRDPLYGLKKLVHLGLGFSQPKPKISLGFVSDFKESLQSLSIDGDYKDTLSTIPTLTKLKKIWFSSTKLDGFDFLDGLRIETLGNYGGRVASFDFLPKLSTIKRLWIKTNPTLESIDFISDLPNLEHLELLFVSKITRFPKCDHLKNLKFVLAYECNRLNDVSELTKLSGIKMLVSGKSLKGRHFQSPDFSYADLS